MLNDAEAFARGVASKWMPANKIGRKTNVLAITLGTGLGSSFITRGKVLSPAQMKRQGLQELWNFQYQGGNLENRVSRAALENFYEQRTGKRLDPKQISDAAKRGDQAAVEAYREYGRALGGGLGKAAAELGFHPRVIAVGGGIANSLDLMQEAAEQAFADALPRKGRYRPRFVSVAKHQDLAVQGAANLAEERLKPRN
jgi:glucokinase